MNFRIADTFTDSLAQLTGLDEVYATERHLLYVTCTRARNFLYVCGAAPASDILADLTA